MIICVYIFNVHKHIKLLWFFSVKGSAKKNKVDGVPVHGRDLELDDFSDPFQLKPFCHSMFLWYMKCRLSVSRCHQQHLQLWCTESTWQVRFMSFPQHLSVQSLNDINRHMEVAADSSVLPPSFTSAFTYFLYKVFIDVVLTQQPWYQQYKPPPQPCALFSASLLSLFAFHCKFAGAIHLWRRGVRVHFQILQGWNKGCSKNPSAGSCSHLIQGDPSWDINLSSQTGSVIVFCQTGADAAFSTIIL